LLYFIKEEDIQTIEKMLPESIAPVKGIMKVHQAAVSQVGKVLTRNLSCFCSREGKLCSCCKVKSHQLIKEEQRKKEDISTTSQTSEDMNSDERRQDFKAGSWCLVTWENAIYPGIIIEHEPDIRVVKVKAMHPTVKNLFTWPASDDILHYKYENVLGLIPEPKKVSKKHYEVDRAAIRRYGLKKLGNIHRQSNIRRHEKIEDKLQPRTCRKLRIVQKCIVYCRTLLKNIDV
jgi:ribosomal protein L35